MSIIGVQDHDHKLYKKSNHHRRNDSDELDVFEAARYFSGAAGTESCGFNGAILSHHHHHHHHHHQKAMNIIDERQAWGGRRISLDMPHVMRNQLHSNSQSHRIEKQIKENKMKYKQPSSPGAKLASFLNSLFNQTTSKKKKSPSSKISTQNTSMKDDDDHQDESHGRRKRRSSISHFQSSIKTANSSTDHKKSPLYSSSISAGFRTPPPYTPTKICKDFRTTTTDSDDHQSQRQVGTNLSKYSGRASSISLQDEKNRDMDFSWLELDEKFKFHNGFSEKNKKLFSSISEKKEERSRVGDDDDGGESDSSSDLFELQNYELGVHSSSNDLPVFETTHIESIKRGVPISNGSLF
ncbi:hypothetical protein BVC80_1813g7 [Macleaya cordata]|uniref:Protein BIG GRAIN 1-like E n=1 Tax=Macleaya cordata TaxID=56857 RepID=A0A200QVY8_MACCD|nr:hypothetical protein BVC80_1813g7 [Macleaya cordata]